MWWLFIHKLSLSAWKIDNLKCTTWIMDASNFTYFKGYLDTRGINDKEWIGTSWLIQLIKRILFGAWQQNNIWGNYTELSWFGWWNFWVLSYWGCAAQFVKLSHLGWIPGCSLGIQSVESLGFSMCNKKWYFFFAYMYLMYSLSF